MEFLGHVRNGVVVFDGDPKLPEGTTVTVYCPDSAAGASRAGRVRIQVPLVRTGQPGSLDLTSERIGQILDEEDASPRR